MLDLIFNFILENWKVIVFLLLLLIDVIVAIVTGNKSKSSVLCSLLIKLPEFINAAEKEFKDGRLKYTKVFSLCLTYLASLTGLSETKVCARYQRLIDNAIENILSTPEKKGDR